VRNQAVSRDCWCSIAMALIDPCLGGFECNGMVATIRFFGQEKRCVVSCTLRPDAHDRFGELKLETPYSPYRMCGFSRAIVLRK
jgi:hypothetical protein